MFTGLKFVDQVSTKQDLDGENLRGMNFKGTNFKGSSFRNADLTDAVLLGCNLDRCDFTGATLDGANLAFTSVEGAIFEDCSLNGAFLFDPARIKGTLVFAPQESVLGGCVLELAQQRFEDESLTDFRHTEDPYILSQYIELSLTLMGVAGIYLSVTHTEKVGTRRENRYIIDADSVNFRNLWAYSTIRLEALDVVGGSDWAGACLADLTVVDFDNVGVHWFEMRNFTGADLSNFEADSSVDFLSFADATMKNCNLRDAKFNTAFLMGANLDGSDLSGANLRSTNLLGTSLVDVIMDEKTNIFAQTAFDSIEVSERTRIYTKGTPKVIQYNTRSLSRGSVGISMSPSLIKEVFPDWFESRSHLETDTAVSLRWNFDAPMIRELLSYFFKMYTNLHVEWVGDEDS